VSEIIAEWLDANVWDGDKVSLSSDIMNLKAHQAVFNPHDLYELVCDFVESLEMVAPFKIMEYKVIKDLPNILKVGETLYEYEEGAMGKVESGGRINKELLKDFIELKQP